MNEGGRGNPGALFRGELEHWAYRESVVLDEAPSHSGQCMSHSGQCIGRTGRGVLCGGQGVLCSRQCIGRSRHCPLYEENRNTTTKRDVVTDDGDSACSDGAVSDRTHCPESPNTSSSLFHQRRRSYLSAYVCAHPNYYCSDRL